MVTAEIDRRFSVANSFQSEQRADCIDVIWRFLHDNLGFFDVNRER